MHSPLAATALLEPITRPPIPPKAAARFAVRAFCALLRLPTRTARKPQAGRTLATIVPSPAGGASGAVYARDDDWRSITVRGRRRRCTLGALYMSLYVFLGARRRGRRRPKDSNGQGEGHHSG